MRLDIVNPVYTILPSSSEIRVTEWQTYVDDKTHKKYVKSIEYTIQLYNNKGKLEEYNNSTRIDTYA